MLGGEHIKSRQIAKTSSGPVYIFPTNAQNAPQVSSSFPLAACVHIHPHRAHEGPLAPGHLSRRQLGAPLSWWQCQLGAPPSYSGRPASPLPRSAAARLRSPSYQAPSPAHYSHSLAASSVGATWVPRGTLKMHPANTSAPPKCAVPALQAPLFAKRPPFWQLTSDLDQEGADILAVLFDDRPVGQGLEVHVGGLDAGDKEGSSIAGEELVGAGACDHGQLSGT
jgi:hypothetical protein